MRNERERSARRPSRRWRIFLRTSINAPRHRTTCKKSRVIFARVLALCAEVFSTCLRGGSTTTLLHYSISLITVYDPLKYIQNMVQNCPILRLNFQRRSIIRFRFNSSDYLTCNFFSKKRFSFFKVSKKICFGLKIILKKSFIHKCLSIVNFRLRFQIKL